MLDRRDNDLITLTGPNTPGGDMMRCYWQPAALSRELLADVPLPVTLLGEELVMFRDDTGKPQLIARACPHRAVDLSYGRVENGGLRCIYHGWLMDGHGRCLHQPGEPAGSTFKDKIRTPAYPCHEAGGVIMAYMGKGAPPTLPGFHFLHAPDSQTFAIKIHQECNYLQANEGNIDPQHLSYLHSLLPEGSSLQVGARGLNEIVSNDPAPEICVEETSYGLRVHAARAYKPGRRWVRITNFIMPNAAAIHGNPLTNPRKHRISENCGYQLNVHVPIDDANHWKYVIVHRFDGPVDVEFQLQCFPGVMLDYHHERGRQNRFKQDRAEMKRISFAGLGPNFYAHDKCVTEAQGVIMDRSNEHLGATDRAVILMRKQLLAAVEDARQGRDPQMVERPGRPSPLEELTVLSQDVAADTDLASGWWKPYFDGNKPRISLTA